MSKEAVRLITYQSPHVKSRNAELTRFTDPVGWADTQTGKHDCRIALCIATGIPIENIDPSLGYNMGSPVSSRHWQEKVANGSA